MDRTIGFQEFTARAEQRFKQQVKDDVAKRLKTFTYKENMMIAFAPIVLEEIAWQYAELVTDEAARKRITETKALSRQVKNLRKHHVSMLQKDLTAAELERIMLITDNFFINNCDDFNTLWRTINGCLKSSSTTYNIGDLNLRTNACMVIVLCDLIDLFTDEMDDLIRAKMGRCKKIKNKVVDALRAGMVAYVSPAVFEPNEQVKLGMRIIHNKIGDIDYSVE